MDCVNHNSASLTSCGGAATRIVGAAALCENCASAALEARAGAQAGSDVPQGGISTSGTADRTEGDSGATRAEMDRRVGEALRRVLAAMEHHASLLLWRCETAEVAAQINGAYGTNEFKVADTVSEALEALAARLEAES